MKQIHRLINHILYYTIRTLSFPSESSHAHSLFTKRNEMAPAVVNMYSTYEYVPAHSLRKRHFPGRLVKFCSAAGTHEFLSS